MKIAPLYHALVRESWCRAELVHTGQHYDANMSGAFFRDLQLPDPHFHLDVGSGSHAEQTGGVMIAYEKVALAHRPDWLVVVGDVNSTLACALVAAKLGVKVAHVEAGLRSGDWAMPEEVNRVLTDRLSDLLLTPSADADENLRREGLSEERIVRVGNVMIDTLLAQRDRARSSRVLEELELAAQKFAVVTLHRPSNVDDPAALGRLCTALNELSARLPVIFPAHPRTRARLDEFGLELGAGVRMIAPLGYLDFLRLWGSARLVLTDSGGLQEETTALGVPCLTLRESTERPITVEEGTNQVVGSDPARILAAAEDVLAGRAAYAGRVPELWDGRAAERIADALLTRAAR
jgi:UDP-N-acetylglucosamine 2-epimerase (non-hydrolysing)